MCNKLCDSKRVYIYLLKNNGFSFYKRTFIKAILSSMIVINTCYHLRKNCLYKSSFPIVIQEIIITNYCECQLEMILLFYLESMFSPSNRLFSFTQVDQSISFSFLPNRLASNDCLQLYQSLKQCSIERFPSQYLEDSSQYSLILDNLQEDVCCFRSLIVLIKTITKFKELRFLDIGNSFYSDINFFQLSFLFNFWT